METKLCSICFNETLENPCAFCRDNTRNGQVIAVVETSSDISSLENQGFKGRYHVLQGVISPRDGIGPDQLRIRQLIERIEHSDINELVVYLPDTNEGDATAMTIMQDLQRMGLSRIKLTRIDLG